MICLNETKYSPASSKHCNGQTELTVPKGHNPNQCQEKCIVQWKFVCVVAHARSTLLSDFISFSPSLTHSLFPDSVQRRLNVVNQIQAYQRA